MIKGSHHSLESRFKLSQSHKGKIPWNLGKEWPLEIRQKIGQAQKGKRLGKDNQFYGRKHTEETRRKIGQAQLGKGRPLSLEHRIKIGEAHKGEKSNFWKGGITDKNLLARTTLEYKIWRQAVFQRDNFICVWCGDKKGGNLEADHIQEFAYYPELRFAIDNGRTLCKDCHKKTETFSKRL